MEIVGNTAAEIVECIRHLVEEGQLQPEQALPPVRDLAGQLGVNRNTVALAYSRLVAAGIAVSQGRRGTVIRRLPVLLAQEGIEPGSALHDLASGNPDPACLPDPLVLLKAAGSRVTLYGEPAGTLALHEQAAAWLADAGPGRIEVTVTHGAVDAIERVLQAWLVPGDAVAVENPCFLGSLNTLKEMGHPMLGVGMDSEGLCPDALLHALEQGARAVIVTPRAQNPTGCSLSAARAARLRDILAGFPHVLVIMDDHFAALAEQPFHSIASPETRHWVVIRSVSKCYGPDLRLALLGSDVETAQRLRRRLAAGTHWVSHVLQDMVLAAMQSEAVARQVVAARDAYRERRNRLIGALQDEGFEPLQPCDGLNVWLPLSKPGQPLVQTLATCGWQVREGGVFYLGDARPALRLTATFMDEALARRFAADLRRVVDEG